MDAGESDDEILLRVARGDRAAFTRLVARHRRRLMALAARIAGRSLAEDIVQETFARAWERAPMWRPPAADAAGRSSYAAWLSRVAVNLALDQVRRRPTVPIEDAEAVADTAPDAHAALETRERASGLRRAVAALPDRQRAALSLTYDAALSNAEGARALDISIGAFELLLVRARRSLRLALGTGESGGRT